MAHSTTWDAAYEAAPADSDPVSEGAGNIRGDKKDTRERIAKDHYMDIGGTDADHGEHSKVTFQAPISTPSNVADKGFIYGKDVNAKIELHWLDEDDNEVQLTAVGILFGGIPAGEIILFDKDTAVAGFTLQTDKNDYLIYAGSGSGAAGLTGGADRAGGAWTISGLTASSHNHQWYKYDDDYDDDDRLYDAAGDLINVGQHNKGAGAGSGKHIMTTSESGTAPLNSYTAKVAPTVSANGAWRPVGRVFTRQARD
jgi:hypothetical protein